MDRPAPGWSTNRSASTGRTLAVWPVDGARGAEPASGHRPAIGRVADDLPEGVSALLVRAARAGDEDAFVALYRHYADRVYRFCLARVGSVADAEDLLQTTFLRVVEALPSYEERGLPFGAWLFRIARNATVDHHRRQWSRRGDEPLADDVDFPGTAREHAAVLAERDALTGALAKLTSDQRDVIHYRFFADLSAHDTAVLMGRNEAAVRVLQARALAALRRALGADEVRPFVLGLVGA